MQSAAISSRPSTLARKSKPTAEALITYFLMKYTRPLLIIATLLCAVVLLAHGQFHAAWLVAFIGTAGAASWSDYRPQVFGTNTIADGLQLTRVLDSAILGLKTALAPLKLFSNAVTRDPHGAGNDTDNSVTVPVYDFTSGDVQDRNPGEAYSGKVSNTSTAARKIPINKEKVVGISFTNEEAQNQVSFDPVMHGLIKGHDLARTVLADIFSVVRYGNYPNPTLAAMLAASFDENDVADLAQKGMEANWPEFPVPGLVLNPAFHFNLLKQKQIMSAEQFGTADALRTAKINQILGFMEMGSNGIPLNNDSGQTFTAATTDIITAAAHGLLTGDQVQVSSGTTLPAGLAAATYYYFYKIDENTGKLCPTLADAVAGTNFINITDTGTGVHTIYLKTNLVGVAGAPSGIITAFRPVIPTAGIKQKLVNFELVDDVETGLTLEYRHIANEDTGKEFQVIGVHYGKNYGMQAALKLLSTPAA